MIVPRGLERRRVGVLGLARSGLVAARALAAGGAWPICWDDGDAARARAAAEGLDVVDVAEPASARSLDLLIVSPGVPHLYPRAHPAIAAAWTAGVPVDNDVGLFFAEQARLRATGAGLAPRVVAVTGSNGKSTTTALIAHTLAQGGRTVALGGNIGRGVLDLEPLPPDGVYVLELSSYQCDLARVLAPDIAVFTNLTPDHLDRHGGLGGYLAAKRRLLEAAGAASVGVDEPEGRFLAASLGARATKVAVARAAEEPDAATAVEAVARIGAERIDLARAPALRGAHNWQNALHAAVATRVLGLEAAAIARGFESFPGLEHRMQRIAVIGGVAFVNDSKATNADAASKALASFERIRWIVGGRAKDGGIESLAPFHPRVVKAYLIGEAAPAFAATLGSAVAHEIAGDLATAVARAAAEARPGETVLLAPACASFDQFADFEARGRAFAAAVAALGGSA